ncbi:hypothetical protein ACH4VM_38090 [Streptomyces sp. NPDC020792]|uniref:hypothetical protein n=1 Tax=Streptomyces sp. NPDC020792 TaxID=3365089 RepID=UPI00378C5B96
MLQLASEVWPRQRRTACQRAADMAASFLGALQERGFRGDEELADRLRAATEDAAIPLLRPLVVDLEMLAMLLEGDRPNRAAGWISYSPEAEYPTGRRQYAEPSGIGPAAQNPGGAS